MSAVGGRPLALRPFVRTRAPNSGKCKPHGLHRPESPREGRVSRGRGARASVGGGDLAGLRQEVVGGVGGQGGKKGSGEGGRFMGVVREDGGAIPGGSTVSAHLRGNWGAGVELRPGRPYY